MARSSQLEIPINMHSRFFIWYLSKQLLKYIWDHLLVSPSRSAGRCQNVTHLKPAGRLEKWLDRFTNRLNDIWGQNHGCSMTTRSHARAFNSYGCSWCFVCGRVFWVTWYQYFAIPAMEKLAEVPPQYCVVLIKS